MKPMKSAIAAALLMLGIALSARGADNPLQAAPAPAAALPAGHVDALAKLKAFDHPTDADASGAALAWQMETGSAGAAASDAVHQLSHYFDEAPVMRGAISNGQDTAIMALFSARLKGQDVSGIMVVCADLSNAAPQPANPLAAPANPPAQPAHPPLADGGAPPAAGQTWIGIVYDRPQSLRSSADHLLALLAPKAPAFVIASAQAQQAVQQAMANGQDVVTCDQSLIHLPQGWKILTQSPGQLILGGPNEMTIDIGALVNFATPEGNAQWQRIFHTPQPGVGVAAYAPDVKTAMQSLADHFDQTFRGNGSIYRLVEITSVQEMPAQPMPQAMGQPSLPPPHHALVTSVFDAGPSDHPTRCQSIADMYVYPTDAGHWSIMFSAIVAPQADFEKDRPLLTAIAFSYRFNPQGFAQAMHVMTDAQNCAIKSLTDSAMNMMRTSDHNFRVVDAILTDSQEVSDGSHKYLVPMSRTKESIDTLNHKWGSTFSATEIK